MRPVIVYLPHFSKPVRGKQHYIGSTYQDKIATRLRAHQNGYGSRITKQAWKEGATISLSTSWLMPDRTFEYQIKRRGHAKTYCRFCQSRDLWNELAAKEKSADLIARPAQWEAFD